MEMWWNRVRLKHGTDKTRNDRTRNDKTRSYQNTERPKYGPYQNEE